MLKVTAQNLYDEVQAAQRYCEKHREWFGRQVQRYASPFYGRFSGKEEYFPENYYYSYVAHTVARLTAIEPKIRLSTARDQARVQALEDAGNRWILDTNYQREREKLGTDFCFAWSVAIVTQGARTGFEQAEDPVMTPKAIRLSPRRFGWDPLSLSIEEARYMYHVMIRDKDDILEDAKDEKSGWIKENIESVPTDIDAKGLRNKYEYGETPSRNEVIYYEIWVPEYTLPEDDDFWSGMSKEEKTRYHGTIFTVAWASEDGKGQAAYLRDPRPYFGPRWGPYIVGGQYTVPDESAPLSALTANEGQIQELNNQARANNNAAQRRKTLALVDGLKPAMINKLAAAPDGDIVAVSGIEKNKVVEIEVGGASQDAQMREFELRGRVDRNLAMGDAVRGQVSGAGTATENAIAAQASSALTGFVDMKFMEFEKRLFRSVLWYFDQDERSVLPLGREYGVFVGGQSPEQMSEGIRRAVKAGYMPRDQGDAMIQMLGQMTDTDEEGSGMSFDDLEIHIDAVRNDGSEVQKMIAASNAVMQMLPAVMSAPFWDWKSWLKRWGEAFNMPDLDQYLNLDAAAEMASMNMEMQMMSGGGAGQMGGRPGGGQPEPVRNAPKLAQNQGFGKAIGASVNPTKSKTQGKPSSGS
jgi:hypothetical protein